MNEPIDVQKTLPAYGAELDELRVWCRKQEERIAELEKQVAWLAIFQDGQVKQMMREDATKAALEAQAAPAPEYAPGFTTDKGAGMGNFPLDDEDEPDDIFFEVDEDTCIIQLTVNGEEHWLEGVTVEGMKSIIGAAMAVLKRMKMGVE